ncbi:MAG: tyrosine-type recombinase/integrase [Clostridia bacterium]|nr:tyrosine-type recombinase/integrase [Clostridia bacterium]
MDKKNIVIKIGEDLLKEIAPAVISAITPAIISAFEKIGELLNDSNLPERLPLKLNYFEYDDYGNLVSGTNIENSIKTYSNSPKDIFNKENLETMKRIKKIKNVYQRKDGRYEWKKMIAGVKHYLIDNNIDNLCKKISEYKKGLKKNINKNHSVKYTSFYNLAENYYDKIILNKVKTKQIKSASAVKYQQTLKYLKNLKKQITMYDKESIIEFLSSFKIHRTGAYCYFMIKHIFEEEFEKGTLTRNPIATLKNPFSQKRCSKKRTWLDIEEQKILKANLDNSIFSKEILFYLLTGCRLEEAFTAKLIIEKQFVEITRKKTEFSGVQKTYIPLSNTFLNLIKNDWKYMFKITPHAMSLKISRYLESIGIKNKTTHSLRHTFSTNTYYLGTDPKRQQYLLGHASINQTYDTYTTFDITITKEDILNIWNDLYPEF